MTIRGITPQPGTNWTAWHIERDREVVAASPELKELRESVHSLRTMLAAEQKAGKAIVNKLCAAMGTWTGPWDNAAEERLRAERQLRESSGEGRS